MADKPYTKTRVVQPPAHAGKWVVQGWWPSTEVWADIGDPVDSYAEANEKLNQLTMYRPGWDAHRAQGS